METHHYIRHGVRWIVTGIPFGVFKEMLDAMDTEEHCEVVHRGYLKEVLKYTRNQETFYIKHGTVKNRLESIQSLFSPSKMRREWDQGRRLLGKNIRTAEPVAFGEKNRWGMFQTGYVITRAIQNCVPVKGFLAGLPQATGGEAVSRRNTLLRNLVRYVKTMHDNGVFHGELHAENVLVDPDDVTAFYLVDIGRARTVKNSPISWRVRELARLLYSITDVCTGEEIKEFVNNYEPFASGSPAGENKYFHDEVFSKILKIKHRLWRSRTKKCLKNNNVFKETKLNHYRVNMRNEWDVNLLADVIGKHARALCDKMDNVIKVTPKVGITRVPVTGGNVPSVFVKEYRYVSFWKGIFYAFFRSPARKAWLAAHGLLALNIRTPKPIALFEEKRFYGIRKSVIIMEDISACLPCNVYVREKFSGSSGKDTLKKKRRFISCLAQSFKQLHDALVYHGDLKANNIMVKEKQDGWDFFYLDLDRVCFDTALVREQRIKNLSQLNASLPHCITYTDRLRFYQTYMGIKQLGRENKLTIRAIVQLSIQRKHVWNPGKWISGKEGI